MQSRRFGKTGLSVSTIAFGCARIGGLFEGAGRKPTVRLLERAVDEGITFFDTADMYTQGESERLVGTALKSRRDRVVIATKFGYVVPRQKRWVSRIKPVLKPLVVQLGLRRRIASSGGGQADPLRQDFSAVYIRGAIEASLRRLNTDYIDIYQLHSPPLHVLQRGDFVEPLERLREEGKIRYWGVACESPDDVAVCLRFPSVASVQVGVNALEQDALDSAIPLANSHGVGVIGRQVFASGLLTRRLEDIESRSIESDQKREQLGRYAAIAENSGRSRAELAIQYALAIDGLSVVLVGFSRMDQLDEALRACRAPGLTTDEQQLIIASRRPRLPA